MFSRDPFRLIGRVALLALICAATPAVGQAASVARVEFAIGSVNAIAPDGKVRPLAKGSEINVGDTIDIAEGRAQVRFTDGAYASLQPQTQFRVDEYRYEGKADGSEKGFFSLLKGGLRTITGVIGRVNRETYQVYTSTATIGIRGTEYLAKLGSPLTVSVGGGAISLTNKAGILVISEGQSAFVADFNTLPVIIFDKPFLPPEGGTQASPPNRDTLMSSYVAAENRGVLGNPLIVPPPTQSTTTPPTPPPPAVLTSGSGFDLVFSASNTGFNSVGLMQSSPPCVTPPCLSNATFNAAGQLTGYTVAPGGGSSGTAALGTAMVTNSGADSIIGWGRWTGGVTIGPGFPHPQDFTTGNQSFHYVVGIPTPSADLMALQAGGIMATYSLLGATTPSFSDGVGAGLGTGSVTGSLSANFGTSQVTTNLMLAFPTQTFTITANNQTINANATFGGLASTVNATFCSTSPCLTSISGFFAGPNAARAGLGYQTALPSGLLINGAAAFTKN